MAAETRHAAWQTGRSLAVRLLVEQGPPEDLASGFVEFLDAVDFAFEWLNREDPARDRRARLAIFETRDGVTEEVWTYPPPKAGGGQELVKLFGFDPVTWDSGAREFSAGERRTRLRQLVPATVPDANVVPRPGRPNADHPAATEPTTSVAPPERDTIPSGDDAAVADGTKRPLRKTARPWIAATARSAWDDPVSRACLFLGIASLWLSLSLADPAFLTLLLISLPCLWWQQRHRRAAPAEADTDDWL